MSLISASFRCRCAQHKTPLDIVNTVFTLPTVGTFSKSSEPLTNLAPVGTDADMKDKWIQIRDDGSYKKKLADLRRAETEVDLPSESEMVRLLIDRAHEALEKGKK